MVPYDASNSSVRVRVLHWFQRVGVGTIHGPGFNSGDLPDDATVLLLRNARKFTRGRHEARLLSSAKLGIYELDDGLPWDDGALPDLGRWWKRPWPRSLVAARAAVAADRMIVGNQVLADWAVDHCSDVRLIPTCVEPDDYVDKTDFEVGEVPLIGWIGSPATEHFVTQIAPALAVIHQRLGARLQLVSGTGATPAALAPFTDRVMWNEAVAAQLPARWDVGIMPLHDGVYERAKCGYKVLQYASAGLPTVGSPVGVNRQMLEQMDGFSATTTEEWVDALTSVLGESASRRQQRGRAGQAMAVTYSYREWEPAWRDAVGLSPARA
ncbi:MAG TPA: glycosyltransferase [Ilumatobacteraceae bacterium]|nr:glycosyltransferase [Ilumatobacteraceae bacterium]